MNYAHGFGDRLKLTETQIMLLSGDKLRGLGYHAFNQWMNPLNWASVFTSGVVINNAYTNHRILRTYGSRELFHYTNPQASEAILPSGFYVREGSYTYLTTKGNLTPLQAHIELSLSSRRGLPQSILKINAKDLWTQGILPDFGPRSVHGGVQPGGGVEV
ncbi:hypothetical protein WDZ92_38160, partial [Nostoc sp. NIES-2111]